MYVYRIYVHIYIFINKYDLHAHKYLFEYCIAAARGTPWTGMVLKDLMAFFITCQTTRAL